MNGKKVLVIGCGASGMMAAIAAAKAGASVTVLDGQKTPGRKLLITGNGRCNLTNLSPRIETQYRSAAGEDILPFAESILGQLPPDRTLDLFHRMGLLTMVEHGSCVYPVSGQSQSVLNVLLQTMKELGVKVKLSEKVTGIGKTSSGSGWSVRTEGWSYEADAVVLACGGRSYPRTGSDGSGYLLAESLGITVTDTFPALTGISVVPGKQPVTLQSLIREQEMLYGSADLPLPGKAEVPAPAGRKARGRKAEGRDNNFPGPLAGVRMNAGVSVFIDRIPAVRDIGQLQFTTSDLSGIVVFQVSREVSRALHEGKNAEIRLDLLPGFTEDEVETILSRFGEDHKTAPLSVAFSGFLPRQIIPLILKAACPGQEGAYRVAADMDRNFIRAVSETIKSFRLEAGGVRGFDSCQVTAGGVSISMVDPESLSCRRPDLAGIYLAGEMLDADGPCGGYNLQWAWSSGYVAGTHAAGLSR